MATNRLNDALLTTLDIANYRSKNAPISIVHLGIGAFHRAHQAWYTDNVNLTSKSAPWYIAGVSLRSASVREQLAPQDGLYHVIESDKNGKSATLIQAVKQLLVAPENPEAVLTLMTKPDTKIVSLTVTEKGYCHDPATNKLDFSNPSIVHDLENLDKPKSAIGFIASSLQKRFTSHGQGLTVLCCDNLPQNGTTLKGLICEFAEQLNPNLVAWIKLHVSFPNSMVDRIVPATTPQDIEDFQQDGIQDLGLVKSERFSQWVIEDNFVAGRPAWEYVGVTLVEDVEPFENAKLRLLNGAHSALAYIGFLSGYQYVHEVMADEYLTKYLKHVMHNEIMPTLSAPPGLDLTQYINDLLERFRNPVLHHSTYQIAMDGSQKLPQRLLNTVIDRIASQESIEGLSFAIASWLRYTMAFDQKGDTIEVQDPLADTLLIIRQQHWDHIDELIRQYLDVSSVFPASLSQSDIFSQRVTYWLSYILANGVQTALQSLLLEVQDYSIKPLGALS